MNVGLVRESLQHDADTVLLAVQCTQLQPGVCLRAVDAGVPAHDFLVCVVAPPVFREPRYYLHTRRLDQSQSPDLYWVWVPEARGHGRWRPCAGVGQAATDQAAHWLQVEGLTGRLPPSGWSHPTRR